MGCKFDDNLMEVADTHPLENQFGAPPAALFIYITGNSDPMHLILLRSPDEADAQIQSIIAAGGFWVSRQWYPYHSINHFLVE